MNILLLEDDILFAQSCEDFLSEEGFCVDIVSSGKDAISKCFEKNYDLYLLDINVSPLNGLEFLKEVRCANDNTPAIYLTSYKDKDSLKQGFLNGADDYLTKPVDLDELILRIKSVLKRANIKIERVQIGESLEFCPKNKRVFENGVDINLPIKIVLLLELCLQNNGQIITKDMIVSKLWSCEQEYSEGSIRVYVTSVKKILGENSLKNIKGIGYKVEF